MSAPLRLTRSLEDYRSEKVQSMEEFALHLGITEQTYIRMLNEPEKIRFSTRRKVLERLNLPSPYLLAEFSPRPSPYLQAQIHAVLEQANQEGWVAFDPDTFTATGERFSGTGERL